MEGVQFTTIPGHTAAGQAGADLVPVTPSRLAGGVQGFAAAFAGGEDQAGGEYSYFNPKLLDNWAGPSFWKFKKAGPPSTTSVRVS